jgi:hypothetical protein
MLLDVNRQRCARAAISIDSIEYFRMLVDAPRQITNPFTVERAIPLGSASKINILFSCLIPLPEYGRYPAPFIARDSSPLVVAAITRKAATISVAAAVRKRAPLKCDDA